MFVPVSRASPDQQADLGAIQKTLESAVVKQRLMDFGLSLEEALARINRLSDEQTHNLAANLDSLQAGADGGVDALIFLLLVVIIEPATIYTRGYPGSCA
jgi:uncharacterized protein DUF6627